MLVYIDSLHALEALEVLEALYAFQVLHVLVYIDVLHARELFVYINLPLLRHTRHSMYSTPVYYLYTRVVLCTRSQLCSHLKICFTPISLSSSFLLQLDLYVYIRLPRAPLHRSMCICKHFVAFHRDASRTWQCNIRLI